MKKIFISLTFMSMVLKTNAQNDSVKNVELPAAVIKQQKFQLLDEKNLKEIKIDFLKRTNQTQDVPYVLNGLSNVVVSSDAGTGTGYTDIKVRGTDLNRINVTMNGIPVNDPESQATYFVNTPDLMSSAQSVELVKGVGNSKNGNGSFGASLAINNLDVNNKEAQFNFSTSYGSFNTFKSVARASTGLINNKFIATLRASNITSDGYVDRATADLKSMQLTAKYLIDKNTQIVFNYLKGKEKTGQAWNGIMEDILKTNRTFNELGIKADGTFYNNQTDNYGQDYYQLFFDKKLNHNWSVGSTLFYTKGKGYYEEYKLSQQYADYNLSNPIIGADTIRNTDLVRQLWLDNDYYGGRWYANYFSKKLNAGLFLNFNQYNGRHHGDVIWSQYPIEKGHRWYKLSSLKTDINLYSMADYTINNKWSVFADMQYRKVNYQINGFRKNPTINHDLNWNFFNPKFKLTYKKTNQQLSLMLGVAQKEPNRDDIEANVNELPKPEKMTNVELNYIYTIKNKLAFYATSYLMYYKDQLVLTGKINDVGAYTRTNIPTSYRYGIELETKWQPSSKFVEINGNISFSQNKIQDFTEYLDDYDNGGQAENKFQKTDISFSPNMVAGLTTSLFPLRNSNYKKIQNASIDIIGKYVGRQFLDNTSNSNRQLKAFETIDMTVNIPYQLNTKQNIGFRIGLYNILNKKFEARGASYNWRENNQVVTLNYFFPQAGFHFMTGIVFNF